MTQEEFETLQIGDIICYKGDSQHWTCLYSIILEKSFDKRLGFVCKCMTIKERGIFWFPNNSPFREKMMVVVRG